MPCPIGQRLPPRTGAGSTMPATQVLQQRNQRDPLSSPFKSRFKKCARQDITVPGNLVGQP